MRLLLEHKASLTPTRLSSRLQPVGLRSFSAPFGPNASGFHYPASLNSEIFGYQERYPFRLSPFRSYLRLNTGISLSQSAYILKKSNKTCPTLSGVAEVYFLRALRDNSTMQFSSAIWAQILRSHYPASQKMWQNSPEESGGFPGLSPRNFLPKAKEIPEGLRQFCHARRG